MKYKQHLWSLFFFYMVCSLQAQHTISGSFSPAGDYSWLIAYQLDPNAETYVADTAIKEGKFNLQLPQNAKTGLYRIVYALPQDQFYFDVIYNGEKSVTLEFNAQTGVSFKESGENQLFYGYRRSINTVERAIVDFYSNQKTDKNEFLGLTAKLKGVQDKYEEKSKGLICQSYIKASRPYIPTTYETAQVYVANKKQAYFEAVDFNDPFLQASNFLRDKVVNYVLTALPLTPMTPEVREGEMQKNIRVVHKLLQEVDTTFKMRLYDALWTQLVASNNNAASDFLYTQYLKPLAMANGATEIVEKVAMHNRLRLGAVAPEIRWKSGTAEKHLRTLEDSDCYILVFWSSTCSHCLAELPVLHERLRENTAVKVVAIGLEDDRASWNRESAKLSNFEHVLSLGKWESELAKRYHIERTPTYFVLDKDKRIIAKPQAYEELISFLSK
ncbi:TlpA disulfide reductase family protein [Flavobacteriaceae bacterium 3-367]